MLRLKLEGMTTLGAHRHELLHVGSRDAASFKDRPRHYFYRVGLAWANAC